MTDAGVRTGFWKALAPDDVRSSTACAELALARCQKRARRQLVNCAMRRGGDTDFWRLLGDVSPSI
jgi:hypothetical protein